MSDFRDPNWPADSGSGKDLTERIERLAALHTAGHLNDAEFAQAKAELLSGGAGRAHLPSPISTPAEPWPGMSPAAPGISPVGWPPGAPQPDASGSGLFTPPVPAPDGHKWMFVALVLVLIVAGGLVSWSSLSVGG